MEISEKSDKEVSYMSRKGVAASSNCTILNELERVLCSKLIGATRERLPSKQWVERSNRSRYARPHKSKLIPTKTPPMLI